MAARAMQLRATLCLALAGWLLPVMGLASGEAGPASALARSSMSGERAAEYATGLLLVFALLGLLAWAARWMQGRNAFGRGGMRVLSSVGLGGKERLMVVDVEGQRLLIGVAPGGVSLIRELEAEETPSGNHETHGRGWLARTLAREHGS